MQLIFKQAELSALETGLLFLKDAAALLQKKQVNQWTMWLNPSQEQINWIKEGFENNEFYFVENENGQQMAMFRLSAEDTLYWGETQDKANYIHSLTVNQEFAGHDLGKKIIAQIEQNLINKGINLLRLDCNAANKWLCAYYEQQGFVKVGEKQMPHSLNNLFEKHL